MNLTPDELAAIRERLAEWSDPRRYPSDVRMIEKLLDEVDRLTEQVDRLRQQNKDSSDAWTRRAADLQSYHDRWEVMRKWAHMMQVDRGHMYGLSELDRAILANEHERAEKAEAEVDRLTKQLDAVRALAAPPTEPLRDSAYYYSFDLTGIGIIDRILSAVAAAGKSYHHTEAWEDGGEVARIQRAAQDAADAIRRALGRRDEITKD